MQLKLDRDERYFVAFYRSSHVAGSWRAWLVFRFLTAILCIYGMYYSYVPVLFTAFGTLFIGDVYSSLRQPRHLRAMSSALEKLERRIDELEQPQSTAK
jgi:hypothetical protein